MKNFEQTIISQYANSPAICKLVYNMNEYIRPDANIDNFFNFIFNVDTAQGFGLDIWGRIVNVDRSFFTNTAYAQDDNAFRELVLLKALSNISASNAPSINQLLQNWMSGRGRCYVLDYGKMQMAYVFEFALKPFELDIITQGDIFLRPAGVGARVVILPGPVFGFSEAGTYLISPFNQAPFISETYAVS